MAEQDAWARPLAKTLVSKFRASTLTYVRVAASSYDPETGAITAGESRIAAAGAVARTWQEATADGQERRMEAWVDHETVQWPISTSDRLEYQGKQWQIIEIEPTASGDTVYASKIIAAAQ